MGIYIYLIIFFHIWSLGHLIKNKGIHNALSIIHLL